MNKKSLHAAVRRDGISRLCWQGYKHLDLVKHVVESRHFVPITGVLYTCKSDQGKRLWTVTVPFKLDPWHLKPVRLLSDTFGHTVCEYLRKNDNR